MVLLGVGFEPTHLAILELESSALDHSAIQASSGLAAVSDVQARPRQEEKKEGRRFFENATAWSIRASIPVPPACKAGTLPIELMPRRMARAPAGN